MSTVYQPTTNAPINVILTAVPHISGDSDIKTKTSKKNIKT